MTAAAHGDKLAIKPETYVVTCRPPGVSPNTTALAAIPATISTTK